MLSRSLWLLVLIVGVLGGVSAHADAIAQLEQFFVQTHTLKGNFTQRVYDNSGSLLQTRTGTFELSRPDLFNWLYLKPNDQRIVSNGKKLWIYDQDLAQVTVSPVSKRLGQAPIALLGGGVSLSKHFKLRNAGTRDGLNWVSLIPKQLKKAQFTHILLGLGGNLVRQMVLYDQFGHRTVLDLSHLSVNPSLPPEIFNFTPPRGVDVVNGM